MKKLAFIIAILMASMMTINAQQYYGRVQDADGYTNIRRGPSSNYAIVRQYQSGDYLYYTPQSNGWSKVYSGKSSNTYMGYMHTSRIVRVNPTNNNSGNNGTSGLRRGVAYDPNDTYINVRKGPGTKYAIASQLLNGTTIYLQGSGKWLKVYDEDMRYLGYAHRSVVR